MFWEFEDNNRLRNEITLCLNVNYETLCWGCKKGLRFGIKHFFLCISVSLPTSVVAKGLTVWLFSHSTFCISLLLYCAVGRVYDLARRQPTALVTLPFLSRNFLFRAKLLKIIFSSLPFKRRKKYLVLAMELMYEMLKKMLIKKYVCSVQSLRSPGGLPFLQPPWRWTIK